MYAKIDKSCKQCGEIYSGAKLSKYCGYSCAKNSRKRRVTLNCKHCNKEFEVQEWNKEAKFCSYKCKNENHSSEIVNVICSYCDSKFQRKSHKVKTKTFCSKFCANKFNVGSNHYEWKQHLHNKNRKLALKQWSIIIKNRDNHTCQLCGKDDKTWIEAHHIKPKKEFPELQFDFNNGITLCLNCHALQHINDPKSLRLIDSKIKRLIINKDI